MGWQRWGAAGVVSGFPKFHADSTKFEAPIDNLGDNLDFCTIKDMLLLEVEIKRCSDTLEVGQGYRGFGSRAVYVKGENVESKTKPRETAPSNPPDASSLNIPRPSVVVHPNGASATDLGLGCVIEPRASRKVQLKSLGAGASSLGSGTGAGLTFLFNQLAGFQNRSPLKLGGPNFLHLQPLAHII